MQTQEIVIYGAGGFAREVAWLVEVADQPTDALRVACFIDDDVSRQGTELNQIPVLGLEAARAEFPMAKVVAAVGDPRLREKLVNKAQAAGFLTRAIVHPRTERSRWLQIGEGSVICAGNILTTNITLGRHVQINLDCTIGHDAVLGDFSTLAPGVHVSGCVQLGKRVYVGSGAVIINGTQSEPLIIGDDATIGAGACVTKSVAPGLTVVGVPAKPLQR
jgi:sugar O-acyltransferase (sialic acid O-acetyltransferase NeuD family)